MNAPALPIRLSVGVLVQRIATYLSLLYMEKTPALYNLMLILF